MIFLSRLDRKKNLDGALTILKDVKGDLQLNIYGPVEDRSYWAQCQELIKALPANVRVQYQGSVKPEEVAGVMMEHDLFFMPTRGENFGHVIMEALMAGCPVLISDQTPWRTLEEKGVGWDLPLSEPTRFRSIIEDCIRMDEEEFSQWSKAASAYALSIARDQNVIQQNRRLFQSVMSGSDG